MDGSRWMGFLGMQVRDAVTGFEGVVTCVSFDLYGCIQMIVAPAATGGTLPEGKWFDVARLTKTGKKPVMSVPDFVASYIAEGRKGSADKPAGR